MPPEVENQVARRGGSVGDDGELAGVGRTSEDREVVEPCVPASFEYPGVPPDVRS